MIIYNETWLANLRIQEDAGNYRRKGCITDAEFKAIVEQYPSAFYTPNLFVRVGLFILTCVICIFAFGLLTLILASSNLIDSAGWLFFLGIASYAALEVIVAAKNHYRSGVDDALLIVSGGMFTAGFVWILSDPASGPNYLLLSEIILALSLLFSIRFTDLLMSTVCCASFFAVIFFGWTKMIPNGLSSAPFIMMLVSGGIYWLAYTYEKKTGLINYQNCFTVARIVALVVLYAAGNYYVIQSLSDNLKGQASGSIPFSAFFWIWTIVLPFIYTGFGIKRKDAVLLRTGLLLITATVLTFRTYYHLLPIDIMLTIAGALVLSIAYGVIKYLKTPKHGFTYAEQNDEHSMDHLRIESLIVAQTFSTQQSAPADHGTTFGGGDGGGGGSSGTF